MSYDEGTLKKLERVEAALDGLTQIAHDFRDLRYELEQLRKGVATIAPFAQGDRVVLVDPPEITADTAPGWMHCRHFIIAGARATVGAVRLREQGFTIDVTFDDESWLPTCWGGASPTWGVPQPVAVADRHTFGFAARRWRKLTDAELAGAPPPRVEGWSL